MSNFAKIENGVVTDIIVLPNSADENASQYLTGLGIEGTFVMAAAETSIGDTYDAEKDEFKPRKQFASWKWSAAKSGWVPPKAYPTDGKAYTWHEDIADWDEVI
jgi:hypothetical protein